MKPEAREIIEIRDGRPGDENFIYCTWLDGLYYGCEWIQLMTDKGEFYRRYRAVIKELLADSTVRVAALTEDPDTIAAYAVFARTKTAILHWVYCKPAFRRLGLASELIPLTATVTHITDTVAPLLDGDFFSYRPLTLIQKRSKT